MSTNADDGYDNNSRTTNVSMKTAKDRKTLTTASNEQEDGYYDKEKTVVVNLKRYRKCACAIVFNDNGLILVGERSGKNKGQWNLPQGGMEAKETTEEAAVRELYEETGIRSSIKGGDDKNKNNKKNKNDIECALIETLANDDEYAYEAGGWLTQKGLAGQRLEFAVFHCKTLLDPMEFVNLQGLDGEPQEFTQMKWMSLDEAVDSVWEQKKKAYEKMRVNVMPIIKREIERK